MRLVIILAALALTPHLFASHQTDREQSIEADLGLWRIAKVIYVNPHRTPGERTMTAAKAHHLIGRTIAVPGIGAPVNPFTGEPGDPDFKRSVRVKHRDVLLRSAQIPSGVTLGLPPRVTVFSDDVGNLWLRQDGTLLIQADGYWFQLSKVTPPLTTAQ